MPTFDKMAINEARARSATGKRAALLKEYMAYILQLSGDEDGVLQPASDETTQAIRRRLKAAALVLGTTLEVRRPGGGVFFWVAKRSGGARPRRGRPPKAGKP